MLRQAAWTATIAALCATAAIAAPVVRRAGEWQITIDNGPPRVVCFPQDATFDQNYVTKSMAKLPGTKCTIGRITTVGNATSYAMSCTINGSVMTSSGTFTQTGPDAFTSKAHSHGGMMRMPGGQSMAIPDTDMVSMSRRLGACKPGDRQITH